MKQLLAAAVAIVCLAWSTSTITAQCNDHTRGLLPLVLGQRNGAAQAAAGYRSTADTPNYAGPEAYGYWADYGWFGPQYGAWYGPGGWNYYSRTGDYAAPFLPPPSMRRPPF